MKKPMLLVLVGAIFLSAIITGFLFLRGNEDTWLCQKGQWIAHGHPSSAQPTSGCGEEQTAVVPTESTLPKLPNASFLTETAQTLTCDKQKKLNDLMQPVFTKLFEEVKTQSCGECNKTPTCIRYIPKNKFSADDVIALENKLLFAGYEEYDSRKVDQKTNIMTFGMRQKMNNTTYGIFFSFDINAQMISLLTD